MRGTGFWGIRLSEEWFPSAVSSQRSAIRKNGTRRVEYAAEVTYRGWGCHTISKSLYCLTAERTDSSGDRSYSR